MSLSSALPVAFRIGRSPTEPSAGGKAAGISRLMHARFDVPPSCAWSVNELREWLDAFGFADALVIWARWRDGGSGLVEAARKLRGISIPPNWDETLRKLRGELGADQVIFRSSMSVEDGEHASLAGCFKSLRADLSRPFAAWSVFLEVLLSPLDPHAAERLLAEGLDPRDLRPGVLVQPFIDARVAGVCFTRAPENPWDTNGSVSWALGAGEEVVQGTSALTARRLGAVPPALRPFWSRLWNEAARIEIEWRAPVDIEWIWDGVRLLLLQARPVATAEARLAARTRPGQAWSRELTQERFPECMTPMGWDVIRDVLPSNLKALERAFGIVAKRPEEVAIGLNGFVYSDVAFFSFPDGVSLQAGRYLNPLRPSARALGAGIARWLAARGRVDKAAANLRTVLDLLAPEAQRIREGWDERTRKHLDEIRALESRIGGEAPEALLLMEELRELSIRFMEPDLAIYVIKDAIYKSLLSLWTALGHDPKRLAEGIQLGERNRTLRMARELDALRSRLERDRGAGFSEWLDSLEQGGSAALGSLGADARAAWDGFMRENGQNTRSWDIAVPNWELDPAQLAPLLRSASRAPKALARATRLEGWGRHDRLALEAIERMRDFMALDEEHHFLCGMLLSPSRKLVRQGARALVARGVLESVDQALFLGLDELKRALRGDPPFLALAARKREASFLRARASGAAAERLPRDSAARKPASRDGAIQGEPMSPGSAQGKVRRVETFEQARALVAGEILVTTSPNPVFVPFYSVASGLVTQSGAALSHGFVSAREYGIPAISQVDGALLPDGMLIRIDGDSGRIEFVNPGDRAK